MIGADMTRQDKLAYKADLYNILLVDDEQS